jgi:hypothetical protein
MKRLALLCCLSVAIFSCKEISYKAPQPSGKAALKTVPAELHGMYVLSDDKETSKDTLIITASGYRIVSDHKESPLGDSLVLKYHKGYYFLSINENPEWLLRIVKRQPNGDLAYFSMDTDEKNFNQLLKGLSKETTVDSVIIKGETLYQINPSARKLMKLIKKGYFKQALIMKKMNP